MHNPRDIAIGAHMFVTAIFVALTAAFWSSTAILIHEFWMLDWMTMIAAHSHLFLFFPLFGTLTLFAFFYLPSVVLTDFYWRFVKPAGRLRFMLGFALVTAVSLGLAVTYAKDERRSIWEIAPAALQSDLTRPAQPIAGCREQRVGGELRGLLQELQPGRDIDQGSRPCVRRPIVEVLSELVTTTRARGRLSDFARSCIPDSLVEEPSEEKALRHCFPTGLKLTATACCRAQLAFDRDVRALASAAATRSLTSRVEEIAIFFKAFFVIVLTIVGLLIAYWQARIAERYERHQEQIVRGVLVGSMVMLLWPLMDYSYQLTSDVLFGRQYRGVPTRITLAFSIVLISVLLLNVMYFIRRASGSTPSLASLAPIAGTAVTAIAYLSYEMIGNGASWLVGPGMDIGRFAILIVLAVLSLFMTFGRFKLRLEKLVPESRPPPQVRAPNRPVHTRPYS